MVHIHVDDKTFRCCPVVIGASLSEPDTSLTALCMCVCAYACLLFGLTTYCKFQMSAFEYFTGIDCSRQRALKLNRENESEVLLSDCSVRMKQSGDEDDSSWMGLQHCSMHGYFLINQCCESDGRVTNRLVKVARFASGKHLNERQAELLIHSTVC